MRSALIVIDFINEMSHADGKLARARGYYDFIKLNGSIEALNAAIQDSNDKEEPIIFVGLGFDPSYSDQPKKSPIFGKAAEFGILRRGSWSSEINEDVNVPPDSLKLSKSRVSAFYGTFLEGLLRNLNVERVRLAGIATDLAIESAARDAHDRDFVVSVLGSACVAANQEEHLAAIHTLGKFATIE